MSEKSRNLPIRVLHPITRLIVGGAQENTMYTAALLDKARYQVEVLAGPQTGSEGSLIEELRARAIPLEIMPELRREISPFNDCQALWKMTRKIRSGGYQIVHTHSSKAGILGRIAARLAGAPVIVHTVHGWSFHPHMSARVRLAYIYLERLTARFTDALIVVTRRDIDKGIAARIGRPEQYHLIRSAIPLEAFDPALVDRRTVRQELGLPEAAPVLGVIGRFSAQKNPLDFVRVAAQVAETLPECRFLMVGDGPLRPQVEAGLEGAGLREKTVLTGLRRDVPRLLAAIDVFLLTSLWEGLPRVIPQALAMQVPVVANQVDGSAEAIVPGVTGYLCPPGDQRGMAQHCLDLLNNPELRQQMGARGREFARQEFDINKMLSQIDQLYQLLYNF